MPGIVSLLPSATEWVCALGLGGDLAGVTFECDAPAGVREGRAVVVHGMPTHDADGGRWNPARSTPWSGSASPPASPSTPSTRPPCE